MKKYLLVGFGGMLGTLLRYGVSLLMDENKFFPWDTLFINITGSFLLTLLLLHKRIQKKLPKATSKMVTVGVLGSYTTFSAVSIEVVQIATDSLPLAFFYCLISIVGSLGACFGAYYLQNKRRM